MLLVSALKAKATSSTQTFRQQSDLYLTLLIFLHLCLPSLPELVDEPVSSTSEESSLEDDCYEALADNKSAILIIQAFLNDLVRDLNLPKESAELLGSRLQHKNLLAPNTTYSWYRQREKDLVQCFSMEEIFVHCHNVVGLLQAMACIYDATEWQLFIDSSKVSLKCVLLYNSNRYASIPICYSVHLNPILRNGRVSEARPLRKPL